MNPNPTESPMNGRLTEAECLAWGRQEHQQRMADIISMKRGEITLEAIQRRARKRMRESGMTRSVAYRAMIAGSRLALSDKDRE